MLVKIEQQQQQQSSFIIKTINVCQRGGEHTSFDQINNSGAPGALPRPRVVILISSVVFVLFDPRWSTLIVFDQIC